MTPRLDLEAVRLSALALDERPQAHAHLRRRGSERSRGPQAQMDSLLMSHHPPVVRVVSYVSCPTFTMALGKVAWTAAGAVARGRV